MAIRPRLLRMILVGSILGCGAPAPDAPPKAAAGNLAMARRLAEIADGVDPRGNTFATKELVAFLDQIPEPPDARSQIQLAFRRAQARLIDGQTAAAVEALEAVRERIDAEASLHRPGFVRKARSELAIAYMRLGEERNCLERHNADACLLPIRDGGVHRDREGVLAAMAAYREILDERPDDLEARWLLNVAAMAAGATAEVPEPWRIPLEVFDPEQHMPRWHDRAAGLGLDVAALSGGAVLDDFDGDGLLDVMASSWGMRDPLRVFRNHGANGADDVLRFEEQTEAAGLTGLTGGLNLVHADYDNDGDLDVLVLRGAWLGRAGEQPNSLLRNDGVDGTGRLVFTDVTEAAGLLEERPTQTAAWADFDGDGWLDLFVGHESTPGSLHRSHLYRSRGADAEGRVTFDEIGRTVGAGVSGFVKGVAWGDVDGDGRPDLYFSRLGEPNVLLRNIGPDTQSEGGWRFEDITTSSGVAEPRNSFPTFFLDFDQDGREDLFVAGYPTNILTAGAAEVAADYLGTRQPITRPRLYRNLGLDDAGQVRFADVTAASGLDHALYVMGSNVADVDNDGFPDLYLGTGSPDYRALMPNRMFRNAAGPESGRVFRDVTTAAGVGHLQKGHGVSFGDVDNDFDLDLYAVMGGAYTGDVYPNVLFENPGGAGAAVALRLEGVTANRAAIGARLVAEIDGPDGGRTRYATVSTGGSFGSSSLRTLIGLGEAQTLRKLTVRWPGSGTVQVFERLEADHFYHLREGDPAPREVALPMLSLGSGDAVHRHSS